MATLENRVQALESLASASESETVWVSWKPTAPDQEVLAVSSPGTLWQRHQGETLSDFQERVNRLCSTSKSPLLVWAHHDKRL